MGKLYLLLHAGERKISTFTCYFLRKATLYPQNRKVCGPQSSPEVLENRNICRPVGNMIRSPAVQAVAWSVPRRLDFNNISSSGIADSLQVLRCKSRIKRLSKEAVCRPIAAYQWHACD
jgi:hypothetical protein